MRPGNTVEVEISGIVREARRLSRSGARLHSRFDHRCADRRQAKIAEQGVLYPPLSGIKAEVADLKPRSEQGLAHVKL